MTVANPSQHARESSHPEVKVPFADLHRQYEPIAAEIAQALREVSDGSSYVLGPQVSAFEKAFARYVGVKHCVGLNSGTSALHLALLCAGVRPGDEVITVPMTFIATSWAISYCGATPVFVDVDPVSCTMDVKQVERKITPRTKAILPVHLYGQMADMTPLLEIANRHGIPVIEDAAQAHGAKYHGQNAGTMGFGGCFSFYPGKNLGAYGEAGALVTNDDAVASRARCLRDHGQSQRYHHDEIGYNYRMEGFQGAVLGIKLRHLDQWTQNRRTLAERYLQALADLPVQLPTELPGRHHVWHLFIIRHPQRDEIRCKLEACGVQTGLHYPIPLHLQRAYAHLGGQEGDFPISEQIASQCLSLPLYAELSPRQQDIVIESLRQVVKT